MFVIIIMKRILIKSFSFVVYAIVWLLAFGNWVSASISFNDSRSLVIWWNSLTLYMGQDGSSFYLDAVNPSGKPLSCEVKDGNTLIQRSNCANQSFSYNSSNEIKIYVQLDNDQWTWTYDTYNRSFTSAVRWVTNVTDNNSNWNEYNSSSISLWVSPSSPSTYQYVGLTVRVYNSNWNLDTSFDDDVRFTISKLDNYGSYSTASSSDYYLSNSRYNFSSSDDGYVYLSNYLQFYSNGTYKVRVENTINGAISDATVYVGNSSCVSCGNNNSTASSILLNTNVSNPTTNQYITTYTTIRDYNYNTVYSYQWTVRYSIERRDSNSSNWYAASNSDYTISSSSVYFNDSDDWYKTISSHIRFNNDWYYRIKAYDDNNSNIVWYKELTIWYSSTTNSTIGVDTSTYSPTTNQYITTYTTIKDTNGNRDYNYQWTVRYLIERRDSNSSNWYTASSNDYTISSSNVYFNDSDDWYKTISSHIRFNNNWYYRIKAYDDNNSNINGYTTTINVGNNSSNSNYNRFDLFTNDNTPSRDQFSSITITAKDNNWSTLSSYNNRVKFQVYRRISTSDSWIDITSSSLDNNIYRIYDTTYTFPSYNNWNVTISNFIKFYSDSYDYKVKVVDDNNSNIYWEIIYYLRNASSASDNNNNTNIYRFAWTLDASVPELNSYFDVKLYAKDSSNWTVTNYNRNVTISLERKTLAWSTSWSNASSSYCRLYRSSYAFSTSDYGYVTLRDLVKCSRKWFYRLKFTDSNNSSAYWYIYFTIVDTDDFVNSLAWFTSYQKETTHELYRTFMSKVNERELNNSRLSRSSSWATTRRNYYNKLNALAYNKSGRLRNYSALLDAAEKFSDDYDDLIR